MTGTAGATALTLTLPTDTTILVTRRFAASPHAVYRAVTEPALVRRWWSDGEDAVRVAEIDLRVGGRWRVVVVGDGYAVGSHGRYHDLVPGARIVRTEVDEGIADATVDAGADAGADAALCTYTFAPDRSGTGSHLSLLTALPTRAQRDALLDSGLGEGVATTWAALEQVALTLR